MATDASSAAIAAANGSPAAKGGKIVFLLSEPVEFNGEVHVDITYRRPRGSDCRKWLNSNKGAGDDSLALMIDLSEMPSKFFDLIDGADFMAFHLELQPFLRGARQLSKTLTT